MLSCSIWFSAPSFWMGGGLESHCVARVYGADCAARHHPHRTHDLRSAQDNHPSKNSAQKTICCKSTSNGPDDGRMYPKHVELRIHQSNHLITLRRHFTLFQDIRMFRTFIIKWIQSVNKRRQNYFRRYFQGTRSLSYSKGRRFNLSLLSYFTGP